nr:MAG TPA: hypothetical protein [Caudoviricetes sp.]
MIDAIFYAVTFVLCVYGAYLAGKYIGRENGYYEGHSEAYRELEHIIDNYIENLNKEFDAKDTPTKGA